MTRQDRRLLCMAIAVPAASVARPIRPRGRVFSRPGVVPALQAR